MDISYRSSFDCRGTDPRAWMQGGKGQQMEFATPTVVDKLHVSTDLLPDQEAKIMEPVWNLPGSTKIWIESSTPAVVLAALGNVFRRALPAEVHESEAPRYFGQAPRWTIVATVFVDFVAVEVECVVCWASCERTGSAVVMRQRSSDGVSFLQLYGALVEHLQEAGLEARKEQQGLQPWSDHFEEELLEEQFAENHHEAAKAVDERVLALLDQVSAVSDPRKVQRMGKDEVKEQRLSALRALARLVSHSLQGRISILSILVTAKGQATISRLLTTGDLAEKYPLAYMLHQVAKEARSLQRAAGSLLRWLLSVLSHQPQLVVQELCQTAELLSAAVAGATGKIGYGMKRGVSDGLSASATALPYELAELEHGVDEDLSFTPEGLQEIMDDI